MKQHSSRRVAIVTVALAGALAAGSAAADDLYGPFATPHTAWSVFAGATRTDNATLLPGGPSDTVATAGVDLSLFRDTGHLRADVDGSLRYEDYLDNTYPGHTLGQVTATAAYAFIPERFVWVVQDTYGQTNANPEQPTTPQNRINANYLSTGPDAALRLGGTLDLLVGARYSQSYFQSNPFAQVDSRSESGTLGLRDRLSTSSSISVNVTDAHVEYQEPGNPSYDQATVYGRYDARSTRGGLALDVGVAQLRDAGGTVHDPLARLTLFHRLTPSWNVNLGVASEFQNSAQALQAAFAGERVVNGQLVNGATGSAGGPPGSTVADIVLSQAPFRSDTAQLAFDFVRPRTSIDISGSAGRQRYQFGASDLDRNVAQGGASFSRRLRPTLDFRLGGLYARRTPLSTLPGDRTTSGTASLDWRPGALLAVTAAYFHDRRSSDVGGISYTANRIYVGFSYGPPRPHVEFETPGQSPTQP